MLRLVRRQSKYPPIALAWVRRFLVRLPQIPILKSFVIYLNIDSGQWSHSPDYLHSLTSVFVCALPIRGKPKLFLFNVQVWCGCIHTHIVLFWSATLGSLSSILNFPRSHIFPPFSCKPHRLHTKPRLLQTFGIVPSGDATPYTRKIAQIPQASRKYAANERKFYHFSLTSGVRALQREQEPNSMEREKRMKARKQ